MSTTPAELARTLEVPQKRIRDLVRQQYGVLPSGTNRWELSDQQAEMVRSHFGSLSVTRPWESSSTQELLTIYAEILAELRQRQVIRTSNAPLGDYAEWLTARVYEGTLAANSAKSYDIVARDGRRVQVKARLSGASTSAAFSVFRSFDFDVATLLVFSSTTYELRCAREISLGEVRENSRWSPHVNGHLLGITRAGTLGVDVTSRFDDVGFDVAVTSLIWPDRSAISREPVEARGAAAEAAPR